MLTVVLCYSLCAADVFSSVVLAHEMLTSVKLALSIEINRGTVVQAEAYSALTHQ